MAAEVMNSLDVLRRQDKICSAFERAWQSVDRQSGEPPRLERYLDGDSPPGLVRELLALEFEYRLRAGEQPSVNDYARRLPEHRELVELVLGHTDGELIDGRFRVARRVAAGGLGQVLVAYDQELCREVALKEPLDQYADHFEVQRRFLRECRVTSSLEHPGIVPIYDVGRRDDGRPFYAMRLIRGESLQAAIDAAHAAGPPPVRMLRELLRRLIDVARTMEYAHIHGVLHRDLKPANIMLGPYGETQVVDWGLAKVQGDTADSGTPPAADTGAETQIGTAIGTPAYMSPEQAAGRHNEVDARSDVYGLGAMLFVLLTGKKPFDGELDEVLARVCAGQVPRPSSLASDVPGPLEAICIKAMARQPDQRYQSASELAADLRCWLDDEPVSVFHDPLAVRLGRWTRQHRSLATGLGALLVTGLVGLLIGALVLGKANRRLEQSRQTAQYNFDQARNAVDDLLTAVSEETLLDTPGLQPLRQHLLRRALSYYRDFVVRGSDSPRVREGLAASYRNAGNVAAELGEREDAIDLLERAVELDRALHSEAPENGKHRAALAQSLDDLAIVQILHHELDGARASLVMALELRQAEAREAPEDPDVANGLASTLAQTAYVEWYKDPGRAAEIYEEACTLREPLVEAHPERADFRRGLASVYNNLGLLRRELDDLPAAIELHGKAQALQHDLVERSPNDMEARSHLAKTYANLGISLVDAGRLADASESYRRASDLFAQLAADNPAVPGYQVDQAKMILNQAEQLRRLKGPAAALPLLERGLEILNRIEVRRSGSLPARIAIGQTLYAFSETYRQLGRLDEALAASSEGRSSLLELIEKDPSNLYLHTQLTPLLHSRAGLFWQLGRRHDAMATYGEALQHQQTVAAAGAPETPPHTFLQQMLAEVGERLSEAPVELRAELRRSLGELPPELSGKLPEE